MIKTIIFDMDGVLIDTEKVYDQAWRIVLREKVQDIDFIINGCRGLNIADNIKFIDNEVKEDISGEQCLKELLEKFQDIIKESGLPMKPGVYELLSYLKENNYEIGLATSTARPLAMKHLEEADLLGYFKEITTGDTVSKGKPDPEIYLAACSKFNKKPEECIAVEDSINGVTAAINAGMKTIMVPDIMQPTEGIEKRLYKKCNSLLEVKEFLG